MKKIGERMNFLVRLTQFFLVTCTVALSAKSLKSKKHEKHGEKEISQVAKSKQIAKSKQTISADQKTKKDLVEWSILVYIQADNDLAPFAGYNIDAMKSGMKSASNVNLMVQWDQPNNSKTWRYQILPGSAVDAGSLNVEMGYNPAQELIDAMKWVQDTYPARKYGLILWNHGTGVEDFRSHQRLIKNAWLQVPGLSQTQFGARGILYDDSQNTCLTNPGLLYAMQQINTNLGKKIDLLGMDACLMAMVEVAYQVKDYASVLVASAQTEPGQGWAYDGFVGPLTTDPASFDAFKLAQTIVTAYGNFYKKTTVYDYTLSAIDLSKINAISQNINQFALAIASAKASNSKDITKMLTQARSSSTEMYMREYIDVASFYSSLLSQVQRTSPKSSKVLMQRLDKDNRIKMSSKHQRAYDSLRQIIADGINKIDDAIFANIAGPQLSRVQGLTIYYPKRGGIDATYPRTLFAKDTKWMSFLRS